MKKNMNRKMKQQDSEIKTMEELMEARNNYEITGSTLRKFIMLTLIHAELREKIENKMVINRIIQLFECKSILCFGNGKT